MGKGGGKPFKQNWLEREFHVGMKSAGRKPLWCISIPGGFRHELTAKLLPDILIKCWDESAWIFKRKIMPNQHACKETNGLLMKGDRKIWGFFDFSF